jgi:hypothetical protein
MNLVRIVPQSPEWQSLAASGAGEFLGDKAGVELWAICREQPIGVVGFEQISDEVCEWHLWVIESVRGRWWTRSFYSMILGIAFSKASMLVAAVMEGSPSHRIVERLGWNKYCQRDGLSYYSICKERLHG